MNAEAGFQHNTGWKQTTAYTPHTWSWHHWSQTQTNALFVGSVLQEKGWKSLHNFTTTLQLYSTALQLLWVTTLSKCNFGNSIRPLRDLLTLGVQLGAEWGSTGLCMGLGSPAGVLSSLWDTRVWILLFLEVRTSSPGFTCTLLLAAIPFSLAGYEPGLVEKPRVGKAWSHIVTSQQLQDWI